MRINSINPQMNTDKFDAYSFINVSREKKRHDQLSLIKTMTNTYKNIDSTLEEQDWMT